MSFVLAAAPAMADDARVTVQLRWLHQFQFAGYYAALELGYYREAGLEVNLVQGGPGRDPIAEVLAGRAQFGAASNEVLLARLQGKPIKVLAVIFQQSPSIFLARKLAFINSPQDMIGRRVMMMPGMADVELLAMFKKEGVRLDSIRRLPTSFNVQDLLDGNTDVFNAYITNEPYFMEQRNEPATIIRPATYGIHFYGDCIFTSEEEINNHPERVKAFLAATLKGWQYAMDHPLEIVDLIIKKYHSKQSRDHLRFEAGAMRDLIQPDMIQIGHMNPGRWRHMAETLAELGLVDKDFKLDGLTYDPNAERDLTPLFWAGGVALGVLLVVGAVAGALARFNRRLRTEVAERTRAEQRFAAMVANVPGVIFQMVIHPDGRREYGYLSPGAEEFFGAAPEEVIRAKRLLPWHPEDRERIQTEMEAAAAGGGALNLVGRILLPEGQVKWVRTNASSALQDDGTRLVTGFILDVTKRKLAENEYLASERKIKAMSQAVEDALIMLDGQGRVLFWNQAAERLFGYSAEEAMGMDFHAHAAPGDYKQRARHGLVAFAQDGQGPVLGNTTEIEAQDRHGRIFPVEVTLSSFQMDDEWYAVGTVRDISARKQAEAEVRESQRRLADILDFLPDPTLVVDGEGRVSLWNRAMERLTGVKKEEILGRGDYAYALPFYGERRPILVDLVRVWNQETAGQYLSIKQEGDCLISESHHAHLGDGGLYLSAMAIVLSDASGQEVGAIETLRDITERKRVEAAMRQYVEDLERFNRLTLGREERMIELKEEINHLLEKAGQGPKYKIVETAGLQ
ncbi:MAG: ABC transporter substrate-binding protein [Pseudomonadota bacterium]